MDNPFPTLAETRYPYHVAAPVAVWITQQLAAACEPRPGVPERKGDSLSPVRQRYIEIAGGLRRLRPDVGDIEIVYVPSVGAHRGGELFAQPKNLVDLVLDDWLRDGLIEKRRNVKGSTMWGEANKYAIHRPSGIPVDFFATSLPCWWNYLVCRTGGKDSNTKICMAAQQKGWKWHPYKEGFTDQENTMIHMHSEEEVFKAVGLPYLAPDNRS